MKRILNPSFFALLILSTLKISFASEFNSYPPRNSIAVLHPLDEDEHGTIEEKIGVLEKASHFKSTFGMGMQETVVGEDGKYHVHLYDNFEVIKLLVTYLKNLKILSREEFMVLAPVAEYFGLSNFDLLFNEVVNNPDYNRVDYVLEGSFDGFPIQCIYTGCRFENRISSLVNHLCSHHGAKVKSCCTCSKMNESRVHKIFTLSLEK